jgi:peptidoglycan/xylan/chitin deacetylase (PgdA/CDA1 family)
MKKSILFLLLLLFFACSNVEELNNDKFQTNSKTSLVNNTNTVSSSRRTTPQIPPLVLMYHEITATPTFQDDVSILNFTAQMEWLKLNGYKTINTEDLFSDKVLPNGSVLITFDDGYAGNYTNAKPVLERLNMKADFYVHTDYIGTTSTSSWSKMSWNEIRDLDSKTLFDVYSHTKTHPKLTQITPQKLVEELSQSREKLRQELGGTNKREFLAYPFGDYNENVITAAQNAGYTMAFAVANKGRFNKPVHYSITRKGIGKDIITIALFKTRIGR